jgi:hypothetical protein
MRRRPTAAGIIPAEQDDAGHYWYRLDHLDMILKARAATAVQQRGDFPTHKEVDPSPVTVCGQRNGSSKGTPALPASANLARS